MRSLTITIAACAVGLALSTGPGQAQTAPVTLQSEVLKDWSALKSTLHAIAAEMPAEKYTYRPTPAQQTFGERVVHIANVNAGILSTLDGGSTPKPAIDAKATTKDSALKALDDSFDYGVALLRTQTDTTLLQPVPSPPKFLGPSSRARIVTFLVGHTWDIYGQLVVYLRLNGLVPPASQRM